MPEAPERAIRVRSLFFAAYRERVGADSLDVELPAGSTVADLADQLRARADLPGAPVVAVNQEYADAGRELNDGDEVAFIPPVAGG